MTISERTTRNRNLTAHVLDLAGQTALLAVTWMAYSAARHLLEGSPRAAARHATGVWELERTLGLPNEQHLQHWALRSPDTVRCANFVYRHGHFSVLIVTLVVLALTRREVYGWVRNVLMVTTALALVGHAGYPLAPPRLDPKLTIIDTGASYGEPVYHAVPGTGYANQFAAMPSMHVAWAALVAIAVASTLRSSWRWVAMTYPLCMFLVVVVTGNHYWLDGIVGIACLAAAIAVVPRPPRVSPTA